MKVVTAKMQYTVNNDPVQNRPHTKVEMQRDFEITRNVDELPDHAAASCAWMS
jgi:hypothetical protein